MTRIAETSIACTADVTRLYSPENIAEETQASGFAFSNKLAEETGVKSNELPASFFEGIRVFEHAERARRLASASAGGATVGGNSIKIWVSADGAYAGSETDYIWMYLGPSARVKLFGLNGRFPAGHTLTWDLNGLGDWLARNVKTDLWDEIALVTDATDGIRLDRVLITHSDQQILDWSCNLWLDGSKAKGYGRLVFTAKILEAKLGQVATSWIPQIHWAAREIGKTDGSKYGSRGAWCSEFASWCLQRAMWPTPKGNIDSQDMEDFFEKRDRMHTNGQLLNGTYRLAAGDYIRFEWPGGGHHSGIMLEYLGDRMKPTPQTAIRSIEGNASSTVKVEVRTLQEILSVGNCQ